MKFSLKHEPINIVNVGDKVIAVSSLPEELRNEIHTLDFLNVEKINAYLQVEKVELAILAKRQQIEALVAAYTAPKSNPADEVDIKTALANEPHTDEKTKKGK